MKYTISAWVILEVDTADSDPDLHLVDQLFEAASGVLPHGVELCEIRGWEES